MTPASLIVVSLAKFVPQHFDVQPEVVKSFFIGRRYGGIRHLFLYLIEFSKIFIQAIGTKILLYLGIDRLELGIAEACLMKNPKWLIIEATQRYDLI
jgi:hypothetical protein